MRAEGVEPALPCGPKIARSFHCGAGRIGSLEIDEFPNASAMLSDSPKGYAIFLRQAMANALGP
jgi:hypothetical protein